MDQKIVGNGPTNGEAWFTTGQPSKPRHQIPTDEPYGSLLNLSPLVNLQKDHSHDGSVCMVYMVVDQNSFFRKRPSSRIKILL